MLKRLTQLIYFLIFLNLALADYTADIMLTDSNYNDIGNEYPALTQDIYVEVYDLDLIDSGSIEVEFTSDSDVDSEAVTLTEVEAGLFRGFIPVENVGFELLSDEDREVLLPAKVNELRRVYPDLDDQALERRAEYKLIKEAIARYESGDMESPGTRDDGILQIRAGDLVVVSFYDTLNDFGSEEEVTDQAVFAGWVGNVSGTWTIDNSPYVVTGDIYVEGSEGLTIDPGVEVLFYNNYSLNLYGWDGADFNALGTEEDSIYFKPLIEGNQWGGIRGYYDINMELDYVNISDAEDGLYIEEMYNSNIEMRNSKINNTQTALYLIYMYDGGGGNSIIDNCEFSNSDDRAIYTYNVYNSETDNDCPLLVSNSNFDSNLYAFEINNRSSICAENNTITNTEHEAVIVDGSQSNFNNIKFNYNNIYPGQNDYDVYVSNEGNSDQEFDFRFNYWGEDTTNEMNTGNNPKNISRIYDFWDNDDRPMINYAGWIDNVEDSSHEVPQDFLTIQEAIDYASDGDEILVSQGFYAESLTIDKSIDLRCVDQGQCVIDANNITRAVSITGSNVLVDGFNIAGNDQTQIGIVIRPGTENIQLENNIIHGIALPMTDIDPFSYGILVFGNSFDDMPTNLSFTNNEVYNVSGGGIVLGQYVDSVEVHDNYVHDLNPVDFLGFPVSYGVGAELTSELTITGNTFENLYIGSNIFTSQAYVGDNNYQGVEFLMLSSLSEYEFDESLFWYQIQYSINYEGTDYIGDVYTDSFDIAADYADEGSVIIDSDGNGYQQNCYGEWVDEDEVSLINGDVNQDGGLNVLDILSIISFILGDLEFSDCQLILADLNDDGSINIYDIILLVNCIMDGCDNISIIEQINQRK